METPKQETVESTASSTPDPETNQGFVARYWPYARPYLRQTWLNLRVWIPVLLNPVDRARQVRYWSRDCQHQGTWEVALPKRCWKCGSTEHLRTREWDLRVHSFEYPTLIVGIAAGTALPSLWLASKWLTSFFLTVALLSLVGAVVAIYLKCWPEEARIIMSTCDEHADTMPSSPEVVVDQGELYLYAATEQLAEAAREELKKRRREMKRVMPENPGAHHDDRAIPLDNAAVSKAADGEPSPRPSFTPPPVPDLPPIKLAGDEDDQGKSTPSGS